MKRYKPLFEHKNWVTVQKLEEELRLTDLMKHAGISNFTEPFMKDRRKIKGAGNKSASLLDCVINKQDDYIKFEFRSAPTYPKEAPHKKTVQPDFSLKKTPIYVQEVMIMGFFKWLEAFEGEEITTSDIKEIFEVSDIKVFCNCPSQHWQGFNYQLSSNFDGSIYPTTIPDPVWGPKHNNGDGLVCKHLDLIFASMSFFRSPMASMLQKKLKERNYL
jgi:hypothetical protein